MSSIRWIKKDLKINFLKVKNIATILSILAIISSLFFLVYKNLNFEFYHEFDENITIYLNSF